MRGLENDRRERQTLVSVSGVGDDDTQKQQVSVLDSVAKVGLSHKLRGQTYI